jgi:hypothetical protein
VTTPESPVVPGGIEQRILQIRGERVIIDADLAGIYGVPTRRLNEQVRRNSTRFPVDFMFRLTPAEKAEVIANCDHLSNLRYAKALPLAFTEHGAIMAASVLNSPQAIEVSVFVVRAFVAIRQGTAVNHQLASQLAELERRLMEHDEQLALLVRAIRELAEPIMRSTRRRIGFKA